MQMLKIFPSDKINSTNEMKHKVDLSKTVCGIFDFRSRFFFIKVLIFVQQNAWTL